MKRRRSAITGIAATNKIVIMQAGITGISKKWRLLLLVLAFWGSVFTVQAQCEARNDAFKSGESVTYDLFFNWKFVWTKAGHATLRFDSITFNSRPAYRVFLLASGNKKADFFLKMRDTLMSVVSDRLEPIYFRKGAEEGKRMWVDEARFSFRDGVCHAKQKRTRNGQVTEVEHSDSRCIHDMLSILAQARSFDPKDFQVGQRINFPMATGRRVEEQTLIYRGKKSFKAENDSTYRCLVFSFVERKNEKDNEVITFYITDDKNHLPVRLDLFLRFGSAKAFLRDVRGNRHPLTSIIRD